METEKGEKIKGDYFILCTGGVSYPQTGSEGDGHKIAKKLGHNIKELKPSLVPLETKEEWVKDLQGLALKNVEIKINKTLKIKHYIKILEKCYLLILAYLVLLCSQLVV